MPTHCSPFCQANHDKPLVAYGSVAFGLATTGSAAFGLCLQDWWVFSLAMLVDCFGFGYGWLCVFAAAGCVASGFVVMGLAAEGFETLGLAAAGLAAGRFMQHPVHRSDAADT